MKSERKAKNARAGRSRGVLGPKNTRARGVLGARKCARGAFSERKHARVGRSRAEQMRARGVFGPRKCAPRAKNARSGFSQSETYVLGATAGRRHVRLGRRSGRQNAVQAKPYTAKKKNMHAHATSTPGVVTTPMLLFSHAFD